MLSEIKLVEYQNSTLGTGAKGFTPTNSLCGLP